MLTKNITCKDFFDREYTETHYFNLNEVELAELQKADGMDLQKRIKEATDKKDVAETIAIFKLLIEKAYGRVSEDGRKFHKSPEMTAEFMESPAYPALVMEFGQVEGAADAFLSGILPAKVWAEVQAKKKELSAAAK